MQNNSYIIQSKNNDLISKSSSGGMFAELAKYVLSRNGVVFGCAMERVEDGFDVKHIYIEKEDDLYKLQGSKYVQSNLGNTIKQAKDFLEQGRLVLFSGTPCQITGLKAYLKHDCENLLTVDLSCTGTPSLKIFNSYIEFLEKKYKQKIINFEFRNKMKMGWSCGNALITFADGKQKIIYNGTSAYLNLFINKKIQSFVCQTCKYSGLIRVSDITIADAWGIDIEYPNLLKTKFKKDKGISLILINSPKCQLIIEQLSNNLIIEKVNIKNLIKYNNPLQNSQIKKIEAKYLNEYKINGYNGLNDLFIKELGWKYYYNILKNYTPKFIKDIIKLFLNKQANVDCLLMTLYYISNYGSLLTAYALQKIINDIGYSTKLIHYGNIKGFGLRFIKKHLKLTNRCINNKDFIKLNKTSNMFIVGSDNLLNLDTNPWGEVIRNLFNFTNINKKRIMISGSIGSWNGSTKSEGEHIYIKQLLNRFDYLSTREEHGREVFKNIFECESDWINDPVFYLKKEDYIDLIKEVKENYNNKIMYYILYPTENTNSIVKYYEQRTGKEMIKFAGNQNVKFFSKNRGKNVEDWLSAIINSDLIITDSFHCAAFSLIFNKPFVCIKNPHATVRFTSLFKKLGIDIPLIENVKELENTNLDYNKEQVNKELANIRELALSKIEFVLAKSKIITDKMQEQEKEFQKLNKMYLKKSDIWYKKNKLFYLGIIVPFIIPFIRLKRDLKIRNAKNK